MEVLTRLAQALAARKPKLADSIRHFREQVETLTADQRAIAHFDLHLIYQQESYRSWLARGYRRLASHNLSEAVRHADIWPTPFGALALIQLEQGDIWAAIKTWETYFDKQRAWITIVKSLDQDTERLTLIQQLVRAGLAHVQLGQFGRSHKLFGEALEELRRLPTQTRDGAPQLEKSVLIGYCNALMLTWRYAEAVRFIDAVLSDPLFQYSTARQELLLTKQLLATDLSEAQQMEAPTGTDDLWASLLDAVERSETADEAREAHTRIMDTIRTHDVNREIRVVAERVVQAMQRQKSLLDASLEPPQTPTLVEVERVALPDISDPTMRAQLASVQRSFRKAADEMIEQHKQESQKLRAATRMLVDSTLALIQHNIRQVQHMASHAHDEVHLRHRMAWQFWNKLRFIVQFAAIAWALGTLLMNWLQEGGKYLFERFEWVRAIFIVPAGVLVLGFILGKIAEDKLDAFILPKYKGVLRSIVVDRATALLNTYNVLLELLRHTDESTRSIRDSTHMLNPRPSDAIEDAATVQR
jgi:hypothetical protein